MKLTLYILLFLACLFTLSKSIAQDYELRIVKNERGLPDVHLFDTEREQSSGIVRGFVVLLEILDYKIFSPTEVALLTKDKVGYMYSRSVKTGDKWEIQPQSGIVKTNPRRISYTGALPPIRLPVDSTFKIIEQDKVEFYYGDEYLGPKRPSKKPEPERVVVDCEKFARRYYAQKKKYEEYLKEQEKEIGDD